jgi:hypothetical protein
MTTGQVKRQKPETEKVAALWSIGIYGGESLLDLEPVRETENPVLSANDVVDIRTEFVADPFMVEANGIWQMFFEIMNSETGKGEIGLATSRDALDWTYRQVVLSEPFHLSYPYVFQAGGGYYMIPETYQANAIRLYKGDPFPIRWRFVGNVMAGRWVDTSVFFLNDRWWMFSSPASPMNDTLGLFHSKSIYGPWLPHPMNPIVNGDHRRARPAGRVIVNGDSIIRFAQDCHPHYGSRVRAFQILDLTETTYCEREVGQSPVLRAGDQEWNRSGMHHIDLHYVGERLLACVDGWSLKSEVQLSGRSQ